MSGQGRHTALQVVLSELELTTLRKWQTEPGLPQRQRQRSTGLLLLAAGCTVTEAAALAPMDRKHLYKWVKRWQAQGLAGLRNQRGATLIEAE